MFQLSVTGSPFDQKQFAVIARVQAHHELPDLFQAVLRAVNHWVERGLFQYREDFLVLVE